MNKLLIAIIAVLVVICGIGSFNQIRNWQKDDENKNIVTNFFVEGYENKNYDSVMTYLSDDYVDHSPANARGNQQAVDILKLVESQYSDMSVKMLDILSEGDLVSVRVLIDAVHSGESMGIPATGKHISFEALEIFRINDGKIVESWGYWPDSEIESQLK